MGKCTQVIILDQASDSKPWVGVVFAEQLFELRAAGAKDRQINFISISSLFKSRPVNAHGNLDPVILNSWQAFEFKKLSFHLYKRST